MLCRFQSQTDQTPTHIGLRLLVGFSLSPGRIVIIDPIPRACHRRGREEGRKDGRPQGGARPARQTLAVADCIGQRRERERLRFSCVAGRTGDRGSTGDGGLTEASKPARTDYKRGSRQQHTTRREKKAEQREGKEEKAGKIVKLATD